MCYNIISTEIYELKNINIPSYFTVSSHIYLYGVVKYKSKSDFTLKIIKNKKYV